MIYKLGPEAQISREAGKEELLSGSTLQTDMYKVVVEEIQQKLNEQIKLPPDIILLMATA